jgi:hypothetical protein
MISYWLYIEMIVFWMCWIGWDVSLEIILTTYFFLLFKWLVENSEFKITHVILIVFLLARIAQNDPQDAYINL